MNGLDFPHDANERNISSLVEHLKTNSPLAFVGTGLSMPLGYPAWNTLLCDMHAQLNACDAIDALSQESDLYEYAEKLFKYAKTNRKEQMYYSFLREKFGEETPSFSATHELLVKMSFRGFITTNYDPCLEHAIFNTHKLRLDRPVDGLNASLAQFNRDHLVFLRAVAQQKQYIDRVLHLHGMYNDPEKIVLTKSDYDRLYESQMVSEENDSGIANEHPYRKMLWALATFFPFVFIGFSGKDKRIKQQSRNQIKLL